MMTRSLPIVLADFVAFCNGCATRDIVHGPQLSAAEVTRIADAEVRRAQYNSIAFMREGPNYDEGTDTWSVRYWNTNMQLLQFSVNVHDKTGHASMAINECF